MGTLKQTPAKFQWLSDSWIALLLTMSGLSIAEQPWLDASHTSGRFAGQGVIVTGGIGGMIVHRFLSDGAKVAIVDLDPERGAKKIEELKQAGLAGRAKFYKLDVSVRADCFKIVSQISADLGGLHHLVNCVAFFGSESLGANEEDWDKTMKVDGGYGAMSAEGHGEGS